MATAIHIPIESFVLVDEGASSNYYRIVFFDRPGKRREARVRKSIVSNALAKFDGRPKAIARHSGGLSACEPYQLVVYENPADEGQPELKVKVRFRDFTTREGEKLTNGQLVTMTKSVTPEEIVDGLTFDLRSNQKFLIDFGMGAIPICIFGVINLPSGERSALFVEADVIERCLRNQESPITIQRFQGPLDAVRVVRDSDRFHADFEKARRNCAELRQLGNALVPNQLQIGDPIKIAGGLCLTEIREHLRRSAHQWNQISDPEKRHTNLRVWKPKTNASPPTWFFIWSRLNVLRRRIQNIRF